MLIRAGVRAGLEDIRVLEAMRQGAMLAAFRSGAGTGTSGRVANRSWRHRMKACKVDEEKLAEWIDGATGAIRYLGPAVTEKLAQKILAA